MADARTTGAASSQPASHAARGWLGVAAWPVRPCVVCGWAVHVEACCMAACALQGAACWYLIFLFFALFPSGIFALSKKSDGAAGFRGHWRPQPPAHQPVSQSCGPFSLLTKKRSFVKKPQSDPKELVLAYGVGERAGGRAGGTYMGLSVRPNSFKSSHTDARCSAAERGQGAECRRAPAMETDAETICALTQGLEKDTHKHSADTTIQPTP